MSCSVSKLIKTSTAVMSALTAHVRGMFGTEAGQVAEGNHTHDDRYFTETELNGFLDAKFDNITAQTTDAGTAITDTLALGANPSAIVTKDGIIKGSTDNGSYIRHPSGFVEMWGETAATIDIDSASSFGGYYGNMPDINLPISASGVVIPTLKTSGVSVSTTAKTATTATFQVRSIDSVTSKAITVYWYAVGTIS